MTVVPFDPGRDLIIVEARVRGLLGRVALEFVVDTGASITLVTASTLDKLGYNPRDGEAITSITSPLGREPGYLIRIRELGAFGHTFTDFPVHAHDLADSTDIDGLLGLDVLRRFNYEVRSKEGVIRVEPA